MRWRAFRTNVNTHSGMMNSDSGNPGKVFTLNRNERSRSTRIGVHVEPEWVFILGRNMHLVLLSASVSTQHATYIGRKQINLV